MNAAAPAEKEKNTQAEQKKKQRQVEALALPLRETENANAQTQKPETQNTGAAEESSNVMSNHNGIPAVHGSQTAYSKGSELMHDKLKSSLEQTGDLSHPETKQKEMDYKKTLGISELRDYHDIKSGTYVPKTPAAQAVANKTAISSPQPKASNAEAKKEEIAIPAEVIEPSVIAESEAQALSESPAAQSPAKAAPETPAASQPKQEKIALQNAAPKTAPPKAAKAGKQEKISIKGNPQELLASLSSSPATQLAGNFNAVQAESTPALNAVSKESAGKLPKVSASSGSAFSKSKAKSKPGSQKAMAKTSKKTVKAAPSKTAQKETPFPEKEPLKKASYSFQATANKKAPIDRQAQNQLDAVRLNTAAIPTKMQENASLELSGEASVDHLAIEQHDASQDFSIKKGNAAKDIHKDYGEHDIIKEPGNEVLKTKHAFKGKNIKINPIKAFNPEGIDEGAINANFEPAVQSKIGAEKDKYVAAQVEHDQKVLSEENAAGTKIEAEKSKSKDKQQQSVREAQGDVNKSRGEWQEQLNKTETDFARKAGDQAKTTMGKIQTEKTAGEAKAQEHINKANQDARKKKEDADKEAELKKTEKKKESGGFFGWLADKASAFINALKDALNFIFTKLREAVKAIFEFAKKLVLAALELARKAIVSFIKGFASLLKGFLDIALAAFPAIRDKLKAKIDQYVAVAEKYVNQAFDLFKKAVTAIIDFLASAVDALLGILQDIYNLILDAINLIVAGIIKIMEFLFNLNVGAAMSVFEFFGALAEEALGGNPANPIQDIEVPRGQEKQWAAAMGLETETQAAQKGKESIDNAIPVLTKPELEDSDVVLEPSPAVTMDKDFLRSLPNLKEGQKLELGGAGENSITTKQFQESAAFASGVSIQEEAPEANASTETEGLGAPPEKAPHPDWRHMDDEAKLAEYNSQMLSESEKTGSAEPSQAKATPEPTDDNSPEALVTKTGRLDVGRRLKFMGEQMLTGIKAFWNNYKGWIIAGLVAALVVIGAILFFSGGTALGLVVQAIGEALILIFGAIAVARAMGSIWDYVKKAWAGDTKGAAKALATAFAIIVVEFFIDKILMGMGKVFKRMLKAFKSTKIGKFVRKVIIVANKGQRGAGKFIKQGISKIRGTKLVITLEKFVAKGANKLDDLRNKILTKFGFKKIWLEKHGKHIQLWGEFNAKVLLMEEDVDGNKTYNVVDVDDAGKVGSKYGKNGIVLDDVGNDFSRNVEAIKTDQKALGDIHDRLDNLSDAERLKKIQSGNPHVSSRADWDAHESAVNNNLANTHPGQKSAKQVTIDLYDKNGNFLTTIRADNATVDKFNNITIIDAKHQANAEIARGIKKPINSVTDNQLIGYPAIKNGDIGKALGRGDGASKLDIITNEFTINPRIEIHTNDINGNIIRLDLDGNIIN